jgi:hypothetical protein
MCESSLKPPTTVTAIDDILIDLVVDVDGHLPPEFRHFILMVIVSVPLEGQCLCHRGGLGHGIILTR